MVGGAGLMEELERECVCRKGTLDEGGGSRCDADKISIPGHRIVLLLTLLKIASLPPYTRVTVGTVAILSSPELDKTF